MEIYRILNNVNFITIHKNYFYRKYRSPQFNSGAITKVKCKYMQWNIL